MWPTLFIYIATQMLRTFCFVFIKRHSATEKVLHTCIKCCNCTLVERGFFQKRRKIILVYIFSIEWNENRQKYKRGYWAWQFVKGVERHKNCLVTRTKSFLLVCLYWFKRKVHYFILFFYSCVSVKTSD